uniref:Uncharacterized protein n=1 Tax=Arundo donax TaxID=35708 RepID=A0A0A9BF08_ARUDO
MVDTCQLALQLRPSLSTMWWWTMTLDKQHPIKIFSPEQEQYRSKIVGNQSFLQMHSQN